MDEEEHGSKKPPQQAGNQLGLLLVAKIPGEDLVLEMIYYAPHQINESPVFFCTLCGTFE